MLNKHKLSDIFQALKRFVDLFQICFISSIPFFIPAYWLLKKS
ncbi:hypothetical protein VCSRO91_3583 [Vibrio cholerae]|nr:hypothetical protein VCSRO91_3583 [Vibrio cholerae]